MVEAGIVTVRSEEAVGLVDTVGKVLKKLAVAAELEAYGNVDGRIPN